MIVHPTSAKAKTVGLGDCDYDWAGQVHPILESGPQYNACSMPLHTLQTLSRNKAFEYKYADGEEIIVYPSDDDSQPQRKYAIAITPFEQQLVRDSIRDAGTIKIGASRDKPPRGSLGATLKAHGCSPQILSYLSAVLVNERYCVPSRHGNTLALEFIRNAVP